MNKQNTVYTYNRIFLALKTNEILINDTTWMNLQDIMASEIKQSQNIKYCVYDAIYMKNLE